MYTKLVADDFRKALNLSREYKVEGLLACGIWDLYAEDKQLPHFRKALADLDIVCDIKRFDNADIGHAYGFVVKGKNYWFVPVMGTAMMSAYAHFASALGSKKNILIGTVGGLAPGIKAADFILPEKILGNDNALKYQPDAKDKFFYPDKELVRRIKGRIPNAVKVREGKTITCESLLAETADDIAQWSREKYLGVEMEGGLVFALSRYFHIPAAALFYVSDNLIEGETFFHDSHGLSEKKRERARALQYKIAIEELIS